MSNLLSKMTRSMLMLTMAAGLPVGLVSCSDDYHYETPKVSGEAFDPSLPVTVSEILPDSGGYLTQFVIKGSNFGTDPSQIKVLFNGNRQASVVSTNGSTIYGICPKQENGNNSITVQVGEESAPVACPSTFKYSKVERVSVFAGKTASGGYVDGNLIDSRFNYMYGVGVVSGNNVVTCEGRNSRVRMISEADNKVTTLFTGANFGKPAITKNRKRFYVVSLKSPHAVYYFDEANSWSAKRLATTLQYQKDGKTETVSGEIYACALDDEEKYLYFRDHTGKFGRMEIANPENVQIINENCGQVDGTISYLAWNPVDKHFYLSVQTLHGIYKVDHDTGEAEMYAGFNGLGGDNGPKMDAKFRNPTGIAFDVDGNLYITDSMGFMVRKIGYNDGMVTTAAGKYNTCDNNLVEGLPLEVTFNYPYDIAADDDGNFYIIEGWGCDVRKYAIE